MTFKKTPLVSICVPVFNGKDFIAEAVNSVIRQTFQNLEILIQDNLSTDGTWEIISDFAKKDLRIDIKQNCCNIGMAQNWNKVVSRASGDFVLLMSADDFLLPKFVEEALRTFYLNPQADAVATDHFILERGKIRRRKIFLKRGIHVRFSSWIMLLNPFSINFTIFKKETVRELSSNDNFFYPNYFTCDYELWYRMSEKGKKIFYLDSPLGVYRVHEKNISRKKSRMNRQALIVILNHKKNFGFFMRILLKFTVLRFIFRVLFNSFGPSGLDRRFFRILLGEFLSRF